MKTLISEGRDRRDDVMKTSRVKSSDRLAVLIPGFDLGEAGDAVLWETQKWSNLDMTLEYHSSDMHFREGSEISPSNMYLRHDMKTSLF